VFDAYECRGTKPDYRARKHDSKGRSRDVDGTCHVSCRRHLSCLMSTPRQDLLGRHTGTYVSTHCHNCLEEPCELTHLQESCKLTQGSRTVSNIQNMAKKRLQMWPTTGLCNRICRKMHWNVHQVRVVKNIGI
jgi:hypothetical protein